MNGFAPPLDKARLARMAEEANRARRAAASIYCSKCKMRGHRDIDCIQKTGCCGEGPHVRWHHACSTTYPESRGVARVVGRGTGVMTAPKKTTPERSRNGTWCSNYQSERIVKLSPDNKIQCSIASVSPRRVKKVKVWSDDPSSEEEECISEEEEAEKESSMSVFQVACERIESLLGGVTNRLTDLEGVTAEMFSALQTLSRTPEAPPRVVARYYGQVPYALRRKEMAANAREGKPNEGTLRGSVFEIETGNDWGLRKPRWSEEGQD